MPYHTPRHVDSPIGIRPLNGVAAPARISVDDSKEPCHLEDGRVSNRDYQPAKSIQISGNFPSDLPQDDSAILSNCPPMICHPLAQVDACILRTDTKHHAFVPKAQFASPLDYPLPCVRFLRLGSSYLYCCS